jgi:DNA-binding transcriptional regulator LsrR (DeoR family)
MSINKRAYIRVHNFENAREKVNLLVEIARAYYEQNHDQAQIARSFGVSRSQVSRYLSQAKEMDLIQVRVVAPDDHMLEIERMLKAAFPLLRDAVVAPAFNMQEAALRRTIGRAAARYLEKLVRPGIRLCVGSGRSLCEVFQWLKPHPVEKVSIIQAMGNVGHEAFDAKIYFLNAPAILGSGSMTELTQANPTIREALEMARTADLYLFGVGSMESDLIFTQWNLIKPAELDALRAAGSVGDICARFFDINGHLLSSLFEERIIGIRLEDLQRAAWTVAVAGGSDKVQPLIGALRGGLIKALVTDEQTASAILEAVNKPALSDRKGG